MKILHLEDNPADAELFHEILRRQWPDCQIAVADNRTAFTAGLANEPDLILSDFSMPMFSGLEALQIARIHRPETPFLFLSGTIGEERAVEALRNGAKDYIIKDRPTRLLPAIQRAMEDVRLERERRAAEEQMLRMQRVENIGMLASGIAHDFNNVLAPIIMAVSMLHDRHPDPFDRKLCSSIDQSAQKGSDLVRQILTFVRGTSTSQSVDVNQLVKEMAVIADRTFPKVINVDSALCADTVLVSGNPTQLHQILLNLCVNARDAMPSGGTLALRTFQESGRPTPDVADGHYVRIEIEDSGTGIPEDVLARIWEPFFTTKAEGQGTGLGLSTVRGIVKTHGGAITLQTTPAGTTFRVWLPLVKPRALT